jgi:hypothetical protein
MAGPFVKHDVLTLILSPRVDDGYGNNMGECVSLLKKYVPELNNQSTSAWKKGDNVI